MSEDQAAIQKTIGKIINVLGEKNPNARRQINLLVKVCGVEFAEELLKESKAIYKGEGMMTVDGKRKRTKGGVFLKLAKERVTGEQRQKIFSYQARKQKKQPAKKQEKEPSSQ